MSEQTDVVQPYEPQVVAEVTVEDQALEMGWRPKDDYQGDPSKWVSAETYVARKPLFDKIEAQKKQLDILHRSDKETKEVIKQLVDHNKKAEVTAYSRALARLKQERREALEAGDVVAAEDISDKMDELRENKPAETIKVPEAEPVNSDFVEWVQENAWYNEDPELRDYAEYIGQKMFKAGQHANGRAVLVDVAKRVKAPCPDKFRKPAARTAPVVAAVEGSSNGSRGRATTFKPNADQRRLGEEFVRRGVFKDLNEYYSQFQED